ncbi:MAG: hypothetical protein EP338_01720 [Bacteroidetes bacterium]|nr:MAG: hypothetical protein EP338_01720 [Bacteroidota bacterium]
MPGWGKKLVALGLFFALCTPLFAEKLIDTLFLNQGKIEMVDGVQMPYFSFNSTSVFSKENTRLLVDVGDSLELLIVNTDSVDHAFQVKGLTASTSISANDSVWVNVELTETGAFIYYDPSAGEKYRYMGAAGMIVVRNPNQQTSDFYWNMKDHQSVYNVSLSEGQNVDWSQYYPDYFTINGRSNPDINADPAARVAGKVGDTLHIYMVNTGQSIHSIHFHGYHAKIMYSSKFPDHVGRNKDTFPIYGMEVVALELVPHQPGEYPVHDHNLVAVSAGNIYPNGMFLTLLIE